MRLTDLNADAVNRFHDYELLSAFQESMLTYLLVVSGTLLNECLACVSHYSRFELQLSCRFQSRGK
jgi:hypothetical protein